MLQITLLITLLWHSFIFVKLPHLNWLPSFANTWFFENGLVYYKDFLQFHLPLPHIIAYPFYKLSNWNLYADTFLSYLVALATIFAIYKTTSKYLSKKGQLFSLLFFSIFYWYASTWVQYSGEAIIGLFLLITTTYVISLVSNKSISFKSVLVCGILFSLTALSGQIVGISLIVLFIFVLNALIRKRRKFFFKSIGIFTIGVLTPFVPLLIYFIHNNALEDFIYSNFTYYFVYSRLASSNVVILPWKEILLVYSPVIILFMLSLRKKKDKFTSIILATSISTIILIVKSIFHPHHYLYALPLLSLCLGKSIDLVKSKKDKILFSALTVIVFYQILLQVSPWYKNRLSSKEEFKHLNDISTDQETTEFIIWSKENIGKDKILVVGDPMLYFFLDTLPANKYHAALPWHYKPLANAEREFRKGKPEYWIVDRKYLERFYVSWGVPEVGDFIKNEISNYYTKTHSNVYWDVYKLTNQ